MKLDFNKLPISIFAAVLIFLGQDCRVQAQFELKLEKNVSFNNEEIKQVYTRENLRGNLAISPNLEYFIGNIRDSALLLVNLKTGETKKIPLRHRADYALFSETGKRAFIYEFNKRAGTVVALDSARILSTVDSFEKISNASISPDGKRIATARDEVKLIGRQKSTVNLWNADDGSLIRQIDGCADNIKSPQFSSDGKLLLLDCRRIRKKDTKIFNAENGDEIRSFKQDTEYIDTRLSPNAQAMMTIYKFNTGRLWNVSSGELIREFPVGTQTVGNVVFSNDSKRFATSGFSQVVRIWDTENGPLLKELKTDMIGGSSYISRIKFSHNGKMLVGVDNRGRIVVWDIETGNTKYLLDEVSIKEDLSVQAFFDSGDKVLFINHKATIKAVNLELKQIFAEVPDPSGIYYIGDNKLFIRNKERLSIWRLTKN